MARKNKQEGVGFGLKQVLAALSLFVPAVPFAVLRGRMSGLPVDDFERGESSTKREEKKFEARKRRAPFIKNSECRVVWLVCMPYHHGVLFKQASAFGECSVCT